MELRISYAKTVALTQNLRIMVLERDYELGDRLMKALHTHFLSPKDDLASLENLLEKAKREGKAIQTKLSGANIPLRTRGFSSAYRLKLSRFVLLGKDIDRNNKREICLSLLHWRIG